MATRTRTSFQKRQKPEETDEMLMDGLGPMDGDGGIDGDEPADHPHDHPSDLSEPSLSHPGGAASHEESR
jgi:hypothetical protein